jgi:hypothetical protein
MPAETIALNAMFSPLLARHTTPLSATQPVTEAALF